MCLHFSNVNTWEGGCGTKERRLTLLETARPFPKVILSLHIAPSNAGAIRPFHVLAHGWCCQSFSFELLWGYLDAILTCISLMTSDIEWFPMGSLTVCFIFLCEVSVQVFCPIFTGFGFSLLRSVNLLSWIQILRRYIFCEHFLPVCGLPICFPNGVFWRSFWWSHISFFFFFFLIF